MKKYIFNHIYITLGITGCMLFLVIQASYKFPITSTNSSDFHDTKTQGYTTYNDIPKHLIEATITIEDKRFRIHPGIDPLATLRAAYQTYDKNRLQ